VFFLIWEIFQTKCVEKIKTHILCSIIWFRKSCHLWDNVEKYGRDRRARGDNVIRRMRFACWINRATDTGTRSQYYSPLCPWGQADGKCQQTTPTPQTSALCNSLVKSAPTVLHVLSSSSSIPLVFPPSPCFIFYCCMHFSFVFCLHTLRRT
jgi:hypothetical protein